MALLRMCRALLVLHMCSLGHWCFTSVYNVSLQDHVDLRKSLMNLQKSAIICKRGLWNPKKSPVHSHLSARSYRSSKTPYRSLQEPTESAKERYNPQKRPVNPKKSPADSHFCACGQTGERLGQQILQRAGGRHSRLATHTATHWNILKNIATRCNRATHVATCKR